ncbi:argininosuccinate synthase [Candidatus Hecatella orcuttiae]|uniref:argininosuccinate synthase n=1 Tax=Candidatus Hecatella orcuttiae TaxID=1935119 RepID=UPI002868036F|nr:argininosuccinate synthase [Candidatus Hecatella orcuttiae]
MSLEKIVLAYSGGLDTTVMIKWLAEKYNAEIVTVTVNVGQQEDLKAVEDKALKLGVSRHYNIDATKEFVEDYVFPAIQANALYQEKYPLSTALARPLIAAKLVEVARKEKASAVAHGCTGKGNDQVRFEVSIRALAPELTVLAPVRKWGLTRDKEIEYAQKHGIPVILKEASYSIDQNLWGRSIESGPLEHLDTEPPEDAFSWTTSPEKAPDKPAYLTVKFEEGVPIALNGEELDGVTLIENLNRIAGAHGIGRIDHVEDRVVGLKSREVYECPAAACLLEAHRDLEKLVLTRHELMFKQYVDSQWSWLVYSGLWEDPLKKDLDAFIKTSQQRVSGSVKLKLFKGSVKTVARSSPFSLYDLRLATYDVKSTFDQSASEGFIEIWGLPTKVSSQLLAKLKSATKESEVSEDEK